MSELLEYEGRIWLNDWFRESEMRNSSYNDPILDYLEMYGTGLEIPSKDDSSSKPKVVTTTLKNNNNKDDNDIKTKIEKLKQKNNNNKASQVDEANPKFDIKLDTKIDQDDIKKPTTRQQYDYNRWDQKLNNDDTINDLNTCDDVASEQPTVKQECYKLTKDSDEADYQPSLEFSTYIGERKAQFIMRVLDYMYRAIISSPYSKKWGIVGDGQFRTKQGNILPSPIVSICDFKSDIDKKLSHDNTLEAIRLEIPIIVGGVFHDEANRNVVCPDLLVRSDILPCFFSVKHVFPPIEDGKYDIVHIAYKINEFSKVDYPRVLPSQKGLSYHRGKMYAQALAMLSLLDYFPEQGYIIGRGWKCGDLRNCNAFDCPGIVNCVEGKELYDRSKNWIKRLKTEGKQWTLFPEPSTRELYPNMKNHYDFPWSTAKEKIAHYLKEMTLLWHVTHVHRDMALMRKITGYDDPKLCTENLTMEPGKIATQVEKFIRANKGLNDDYGTQVLPRKFSSELKSMLNKRQGETEYHVDFETKPGVDDDLSWFPYAKETSMIAMIGLLYDHPQKKELERVVFTADYGNLAEEQRMIDRWLKHMKRIKSLGGDDDNPNLKIFVWSRAEESFLQTAYNSAANRHGREDWKRNITWCDVHKLCRAEGLTIPGSFSFGLKSVAKALYKLGLIDHIWAYSPVEDGMRASIALIRCDEESKKTGRLLTECRWMKELVPYLHKDIETLYCIVRYFRRYHMLK